MEENGMPKGENEEQQIKLGEAFAELLSRLNERLGHKVPNRVSVKELADRTGLVLTDLRDQDVPAVVTYGGLSTFVLLPLTHEDEGKYAFERIIALRGDEIQQAVVEGEQALREGRVVAPPHPRILPE